MDELLTLRVAEGLSRWACALPGEDIVAALDGEPLTGGRTLVLTGGGAHHVRVGSPEVLGIIAAAVAAGSLELVDGDLPPVEDDEESLARLEIAEIERAALIPERDAALTQTSRDMIAQWRETSPDGSGRLELNAALVAAREAGVQEWEGRIAEAAQAAVEEVA